MINILIFFFTEYFQETHDLVVRISFFNQKVQGSILLFILFISMNEMDEKTTFEQLFQTRCFVKKGLSLGRKQNGSPNHVPPRRRGLNCCKE
jgi:uncharacterized membrane protein YqhA